MLFLAPDDSGIRVSVDLLLDASAWERRNLLQTYNGHVILLLVAPRLHQVVVHLSGAEDQLLDLFWRKEVGCLVRDEDFEALLLAEVGEVGCGLKDRRHHYLAQSQQPLWRHDNQWLSIIPS